MRGQAQDPAWKKYLDGRIADLQNQMTDISNYRDPKNTMGRIDNLVSQIAELEKRVIQLEDKLRDKTDKDVSV